jgi:hypothetical protein
MEEYLKYAIMCHESYDKKLLLSENSSIINIEANGSLAQVHILGDNGDCDELIVVFRGTDNFLNVLNDLEIQQSPFQMGEVHDGFLDYYNNIKVQLLRIIMSLEPKVISFTGHSLGVSVLLLAIDIHFQTQIKIKDIVLFASPKIGNKYFVDFCNKEMTQIVNIIHYIDIIQFMPPTKKYYALTNTLITLGNNGVLNQVKQKCFKWFKWIFTTNIVKSHSILTYIDLLSKKK